MDDTTLHVADFIIESDYSKLPLAAVHECKRRLIDTLGCAAGAFNEPLSRMARTVAKRYSGTPAGKVWGCRWETALEAAAFANGVMLRYLDFNDAYLAKSRGHPSDMIGSVLAVGEAMHTDGKAVINAVTLAYDVSCSFCDTVDDIHKLGWDQTVHIQLGCVAGAGKLLGLSRDQMANAVALTLAPNMALYQSRLGKLSVWKGCAAANAGRNAVFAALLAKDGFTGPTAVFEGKGGLWDIVGKFEWDITKNPPSPHRITLTNMKCLPFTYLGQAAVEAAFQVRKRIPLHEISEIKVETNQTAMKMMVSDAAWAPRNKETADHSLPYAIAIGLLDGRLDSRSYSDERLADANIAALMKKISFHDDPALSAQHPPPTTARMKVRTVAGDTIAIEVHHPKGHIQNPMDDAEVEAKFRDLFLGHGDEKQCEAALQALWNCERAADFNDVTKLFVSTSCADQS